MNQSAAAAPTLPASLVAPDGRACPLESVRIEARAEGGVAHTSLVQHFANPHEEALEVLYTMPLPADGAVLGYTVRIGDRTIRAEVQPREKATRAYLDALFEGRTAGLLEQSRPDTFVQRLGNVPPRTSVEISIDVLQPLAFLRGAPQGHGGEADEPPLWEYRFPTVVGVRYLGSPGRIPDAAPLSPDRAVPGTIATRSQLELRLPDLPQGGRIESPSHAIVVQRRDGDACVCFGEDQRLDRDVVVRWPAAGDEVGIHVVTGGGLEGDDGRYALVTLVPPTDLGAASARDLSVLIDASGSMDGQPIALARRVVAALLDSLQANDRFELIAFASAVTRLTPGLVRADAVGLADARRALDRLEAGGATEMLDGIREAMKPARAEAQRQVVLVTDGQIAFEHEVVRRVADRADVRLHAVGVGSAPNRSLTQQAAFAGRGIELAVTTEADAPGAARRLVAATASPVMTGVRVSGPALAGEQTSRLRDVFGASPLVFTVELAPAGGRLEVSGTSDGRRRIAAIDIPPVGASTADVRPTSLPIGALHGRALVAELELGLAPGSDEDAYGDPADVDRQAGARIERIAMRHRIASRATSLIAICEDSAVDPTAPRRRHRLEVELPAGVSAHGVGLLDAPVAFHRRAGMVAMAPSSVRVIAEQGVYDLVAFDAPPLLRAPVRPAMAGAPRRAYRAKAGRSPGAEVPCHWLDADTLVVEFDVPAAGRAIDGDEVVLEADGRRLALPIDWSRSTRRIETREGMRLRVAVAVPRGAAGIDAGRAIAILRWKFAGTAAPAPDQVLELAIPARPSPPAGEERDGK